MSKLKGNQEFNGDVYVKGVGGYDGTNPAIARRISDALMQCAGVKNIISLTKAEYDALTNKDSETIYVVAEYTHDYVDLGLRDGNGQKILFATCNIGASAPQEYGDYFAWGETSKRYTSINGSSIIGGSFEWSNCPYHTGDDDQTGFTKYIPAGQESYSETGVADNKLTLEASDDVASVLWGGGWRMPDKSDLEYLISANVTYYWTDDYNETGVSGLIITGKGSFSSALLFLPDAGYCDDTDLSDDGNCGYYWSRSVDSDAPYHAWYLYFDNGGQVVDYISRYGGQSIRPVHVGDIVPSYKLYKGSAIIVDSPMTEITWGELKALRDNSQLTPGMQYRITDYITTTVQTNTQSAGHQFDVIVLALSTNKLAEESWAIQHDNIYNVAFNDGKSIRCYFYPVNGDMSSINIVDCHTLLGIAEVVEGECEIDDINKTIILKNYDTGCLEEPDLEYNYFKDCNLEAWKLNYCLDNDTTRFSWADSTNGKGVIYWMKDEWNNECPYDFKNIQFKRKLTDGEYDTDGVDRFVYTFNAYDLDNETINDASVMVGRDVIDDGTQYCFSNVIKSYVNLYDGDNNKIFKLNNNVFLNLLSLNDGVYFECFFNTFGNNCYNNTFGNSCTKNTFGNSCSSNTFGEDCNTNIFGNNYSSNIFGNYCYSNTFGNICQSNIFGNNCYSNAFENNCYSNAFGSSCNSNTFGNNCRYNTFENGCEHINVQKNYAYHIIVENGNQYINITSTQTTSGSSLLRNITIAQGVNNTNTVKTISHNTVNDTFQTVYQPANSKVINV